MLKKHFFNSDINDIAAFDRMKWFCLINLTLHSVKVSSSPRLPLLFTIVFSGETNRNSLLQVFFKINVLKNFANFTGKHQCWSLFLIKLQGLRRLQHRCFIICFIIVIIIKTLERKIYKNEIVTLPARGLHISRPFYGKLPTRKSRMPRT